MPEPAPHLRLIPNDDSPQPERARPDREPLWRHMLGARLRARRHERGETLIGTARRAGVSSQYLSEIERGTKEPSSEVIAAVADALEVTLLDLTLEVSDELRSAQTARGTGTNCSTAAGPAAFALAA
ncbi:helix-turn-helix domain-containing protein [Gryllotalpicola reticulitermitis]|uniref:Helix-turn-helix domain-containing protein n=1 Tax=Gryllotalpicola reticulitermitis TaxID=1184153 RepID=A0ABV8Q8S4_9MICO